MNQLGKAILVGAAFALISTSSYAAPFTLTVQDGETKSIAKPDTVDATHYSYMPDLAAQVIEIHADIPMHEIATIEHRITTYTAVGDEGPWWRIEGIEKDSGWSKLDPTMSKNGVIIELANIQDLQLSEPKASAKAITTAFKKSPDFAVMDKANQARWLPLVAKCASPTTSPCYIYAGKDEIRITKRDGNSLKLSIHYPGGC